MGFLALSKKNIFLFLVIAPMVALSLSIVQVYYSIYEWGYKGENTVFEIKSGDTFSKINYQLNQRSIVYSARLFHQYTKFQNKLTSFKVGKYEINNGMNMTEVLDLLTSGKSIAEKVTIPEGKNLFEIAKILESKNITSSKNFIRLAKSKAFAKKLGIPGVRLEGYLYPDTYQFPEKMEAEAVISAMVNTFEKKVSEVDFSKTKFSKHQVIILASIVEKETGAKFERPRIAGVFTNRLKKRMRLQSDPTTIYGIYENYNGNLRKKHLLQKTPYNTYKVNGLPLGPIANPGLESIRAVISPEKHDYLYFVSKNDGTHIFTKNYKDHLNAVNKWQKTSVNRAGRSWRDLKQ